MLEAWRDSKAQEEDGKSTKNVCLMTRRAKSSEKVIPDLIKATKNLTSENKKLTATTEEQEDQLVGIKEDNARWSEKSISRK